MKTMTSTIGAAGIALALLLSVATAGDIKAVLDAGGNFLILSSASNQLLQVQSDGNVAIGTNAPGAKLWIQNTTGSPTLFDYANDHRNYIRGTTYFDSGSINYFAGNVGIGTTTPATPLDVNGIVRAQTFYAGIGSAMMPAYMFGSPIGGTGMFAPDTNTLAFATSAGERLRISPAGNIGIGTSSPSAALHVKRDGTAISLQPSVAGGGSDLT